MAKREFYLNNPNLPLPNTNYDWTAEQIKSFNKAKDDIIYFAENFFDIIDLDVGKCKIKLYKVQKRILKSLFNNNRCLLACARQSGKSTMVSVLALHYICFNSDKTVLMVANNELIAKELLERVKLAYEGLPNWLKPGVDKWATESTQFDNGSRIRISATSASAGRGLSINCLTGDSIVTVKDKLTNSIYKITIKELFDILNNDGIIIPIDNIQEI